MSLFSPTDSRVSTPTTEMETPKISSASKVAGITFENSYGRYVCFYWQSTSPDGDIYQSTFLQNGLQWEHQGNARIATEAAQKTPIAAVCWANGAKRAVYFLNTWNLITETHYDAKDGWSLKSSLNDLRVPVSAKSSLAALVQAFDLNLIEIFVYYQDSHKNLRGLTHCRSSGVGSKWQEVKDFAKLDIKILEGTPLTCNVDKDHRYVFAMIPNGSIQMWGIIVSNKWNWIVPGYEILVKRHWGTNTTLGVIGNLDDSTLIRLYAISESIAITIQRPDHAWGKPKELSNPGKAMIKGRGVVLGWPQGSQNEGSEIHIFSFHGDNILDYVVDAPSRTILRT
ncbi:hypothetical protein DFH27DRAFT_579633 [Peziza echinospora]|nr:hypothetical protein DFH27DRAFT_579633 [Peziza echinospora]